MTLRERHWAYIREKGGSCLARMDQVRMLRKEICGGEQSIVIKGKPGSGKSTLLGKLALLLAEEHMTVIPVACGLTKKASQTGNYGMDLAALWQEDHLIPVFVPHQLIHSVYQDNQLLFPLFKHEQMSEALMRTAGEKIGQELVQQVNEYIALSRYGLREEDLALLLGEKWNYLVFRQMINYMRENYMCREDGRYDFTHQSIRRGILRSCGNR